MMMTTAILMTCAALSAAQPAEVGTGSMSGFAGRAGLTISAIYTCFDAGDTPLLRETYPFDEDYKATYLAPENQESRRNSYSYLWPYSGVLSAVAVLAENDSTYIGLLEDTVLLGLEEYFDTVRTPSAYSSYIVSDRPSDRFYDDNIWLGIDFADLYSAFGDEKYLQKAEMIWKFIESGTDGKLGGGIYWCEQKKESKNTCSNAPAAVLALKLFRITGDDRYLEAGLSLYEWTRNTLQDASDGLYLDNVSLDGKLDERKFAYNSGQMMQAAVLLYKITGKRKYLCEARNLAAACSEKFFREGNQDAGEPETILKDGNIWFSAVMLRGYIELAEATGNRKYISDFSENLDYFWEKRRDADGLFDIGDRKGKAGSRHLLAQAAMAEMFARLAYCD